MPDITMCRGEGCSVRQDCYRHTAAPDARQAWFVDTPRPKDGSCPHWWPDVYKINRAKMKAPRT